ncbi:MAG TPA: FAD-binding oxidoreductase [Pseudonocardia sp.]|nr:FAD-binding oxidoreductase [Pseudonocardia sp.]
MTQTVGGGVHELRAAMEGAVVTPEDAEYDQARLLWNADADHRPAVVARCGSTADVVAAVRYAQAEELEIAVRCGAHSMSGQSGVDGGIVVDLSGMREVTVDPTRKRARAGGGALLSDLDAATQAHGLAVPSGMVGHTGIGGLTLGGGMGWLTRQAGLAIDNLESVEIVVADGRVLRASEQENPDLFWAVRGGGGNFGVVTEFEYRLHEVGPMVQFAFLFWEVERGAEALRAIRAAVPELPRSCNVILGALDAPPAPFVPAEHRFQTGIALMISGFGDPDEHAEAVDRLREALPPLFDAVTPMPYTALQQLFDQANCWGQYYYEKSTRHAELTDEVIEVVISHLSRRRSPMSVMLAYYLGGAYCEADPDATAFGGTREPQWVTFVLAIAPDAEVLAADRAGWSRAMADALQPFALDAGTYVNGMAEQDDRRVRAAYGKKYERLARIKADYDPGNVFHRNINIKPA